MVGEVPAQAARDSGSRTIDAMLRSRLTDPGDRMHADVPKEDCIAVAPR